MVSSQPAIWLSAAAAARVCFVGDRKRLKGDAALAAKRWTGPVEEASPAALMDCDLIVDALFGAGLDRDVDGLAARDDRRDERQRHADHRGRSSERGEWYDRRVMGIAVNATRTVTFFRRKTGHLLLPGRLHCGAIEVVDIGIPESVLGQIKPATFANAPALWRGCVSAA